MDLLVLLPYDGDELLSSAESSDGKPSSLHSCLGRGLQVPYGVLSGRSSGVQTLGLGQFSIDSPDKYVFKNEDMPKQGCKKEVCYIVNGYIM